jgi:hypothetical protein
VLNDLPDQTGGGKISVKLVTGTNELKLLDWEFGTTDANTNLSGPTVRCKLPTWDTDRFKLILEVAGHPEYNSEYTLLYAPKAVKAKKANVLNQ